MTVTGNARNALLGLSVGLAGCSHYGFADRPGPVRTERSVAVRTVDVDASGQTDAAHLTRVFVAELRKLGVPEATWTGVARPDGVVACDVDLSDAEAFGERSRTIASARCELDGSFVATREGYAQLALDPADRTQGRRRAAELAAQRALQAVAVDVANALVHPQSGTKE